MLQLFSTVLIQEPAPKEEVEHHLQVGDEEVQASQEVNEEQVTALQVEAVTWLIQTT